MESAVRKTLLFNPVLSAGKNAPCRDLNMPEPPSEEFWQKMTDAPKPPSEEILKQLNMPEPPSEEFLLRHNIKVEKAADSKKSNNSKKKAWIIAAITLLSLPILMAAVVLLVLFKL